MATCPTCGTSFHACSNCGMTYNWEYTFCSLRCWTMTLGHDLTRFEAAVKAGDTRAVGRMMLDLDDEVLTYIASALVGEAR